MKHRLCRICNITSSALVVAIIALLVMIVGVRLVGIEPYTVLSGSMEPTYHTGSLIYVKSIDPREVHVGDPISFVLDGNKTIATHRVIKVDKERQFFYTKGDANDSPDDRPVSYNNLVGKPIGTIPYMGYFASFIQNSPGRYLALSVCAIVLIFVILADVFNRKEKEIRAKGFN